MTSRIIFILVIATITAVHGRDCSFGQSQNFIEKFVNSCPQPFGNQDAEYCCLDIPNKSVYCCTAQEWALETGLGIIVPAIIGVVVVVTFFVLCISCLCCSCCPWYRRRHRGTIYGRVQAPQVVTHVIQPSTAQPATSIPTIYSPYPANIPASAVPYQPQPPPYTAEPYAKQAPYNPNYPQ